jgi:ABC-type glycerol-3-phosphate transport system permease component
VAHLLVDAAAGVTAVVPIVLLFLLTQQYFVQGIQMTGFK